MNMNQGYFTAYKSLVPVLINPTATGDARWKTII